jgi:hypothetical protein
MDFDGDRRPDFCRMVKTGDGAQLLCTRSLGKTFAATPISSGTLDPMVVGSDVFREWIDANGDGKTDFCSVDMAGDLVTCVLSASTKFGQVVVDAVNRPVMVGELEAFRGPAPPR